MIERYQLYPGGLMRCCEASLSKHMTNMAELPEEGTKFNCEYCRNPMIYKDGAWRWDQDSLPEEDR